MMLGLVVIVGAGLLYVETLSFRKMDWEPLGMAFWPRVTLIGLGVVAIAFAYRGIRGTGGMERVERASFAPLIFGAGFLLALPYAGFYAGGALMVFLLGMAMAPRRDIGSMTTIAATSAATVLVLYLLFGIALGLRLPSGVF